MKTIFLLAAILLAPLSGDEVQRLVQQLGSPRLAEREAAQRSLQTASPEVLDMLPGDEVHLSAETKLRIRKIRDFIEQKMALDWGEASKVTLDPATISLGNLLETIQKQTENRVIAPKGVAELRVDCAKLENNTFWGVIVEIARQHDLRILTPPGHRSVELMGPQTVGSTPKEGGGLHSQNIEAVGPFLLSFMEKKDKRQLEVRVAWEPRLHPIWLRVGLNQPDGEPIGVYELNPTPESISARLTIPAPDAARGQAPPLNKEKTPQLKGTVEGVLPAPVRAFSFPLMAKEEERRQRFAQVAVQLLDVRIEGSDVQVTIRLRYDQAHDALESYRSWFFDNEACLVRRAPASDHPSEKLSPIGMETDNRTAQSIDLIYRFKIDAEPAQYDFVYSTPIALVRVHYDLP